MCDGCLSEVTNITPRQRIALMALDMERAGNVLRKKTTCPKCGKNRQVTGIPRGGARNPPAEKKGLLERLFGGGDD